MSELYWAPNQIERRLYRSVGSNNETFNNISALCQAHPSMKSHEPLKQIYSRGQLVQLLDEQKELSASLGYPLCFALAELELQSDTTEEFRQAVLLSVARIFNLVLRPTDIVVRYGGNMVAFILHESDEQGGHCAAARLTAQLSQGITVERKKVHLKPSFGFSASLVVDTRPAERLLVHAESVLWANRARCG